MLVATYSMPGFTTEQDARAIAEACKLAVASFKEIPNSSKRLTVKTWSRENLNALTAALDYGPEEVRQGLQFA